MDRRTVVKNLALIIGGAVLLPSCMHHDGSAYIKLKHIELNEDQQNMVAEMAETIIPKTSTPGAKDLNLPAFVLKMVDDCLNKKDQQNFVAGIGNFAAAIKKEHGKGFGDLDAKTREAVLTAIEKNIAEQNKPAQKNTKMPDTDHIAAFYNAVKGFTVFGYTNSQYFMTKEIFYDMVPGRYVVHYPVSKLKLKTA